MKKIESIEGKSLNTMTRFTLLLGVLLSPYMIYELSLLLLRDDPNPIIGWIFLGPIILLFFMILIFGIWGQFMTTRIDKNGIFGICSKSLRKQKILWDNVEDFDYPYVGFNVGFTAVGKILQRDGKEKLIPFGNGHLSNTALELSIFLFINKSKNTEKGRYS